jgi:hypothetical protein
VNLVEGNGFLVRIDHGEFLLANDHFQFTRRFPN